MHRGSRRWLIVGATGLLAFGGAVGILLGRILPPQLGPVGNVVAVAMFFAVLLALLWILWQGPRWYTAPMRERLAATKPSQLPLKDRFALEKDLLQAEWSARGTIAQTVGGLVLLIGLFFTWQNQALTQENLRVATEGQITDRFTKAVGQLATSDNGTPNLESRVGGIYALERIAQDSPERDHWTMMEVLTTYVRRHAPLSPEPTPIAPSSPTVASPAPTIARPVPEVRPAARADIQAALTVLGRRARQHDRGPLDLRATYLRWADLRNAQLQGADLRFTDLEGADLRSAQLRGADLGDANILAALLTGAQLQGANLEGARGADPANLRGINSAVIDETTKLPKDLMRGPDGKIIRAP